MHIHFRIALLLLLFSLQGPLFAANNDGAAVFMYHRFGQDRFPATNIRVEQLQAQLAFFRDQKIPVVPLRDLVDFLDGGEPLPDRAVVLTVDDAYRSVYEVGYPMFKAAGIPFTVFVSTDPVDQGLADYMSWDQMREMAEAGVTFANHGAGHLYMVRRAEGESETGWQQRISNDIDRAGERLKKELPRQSLLLNQFAYPYGEYDTTTARILQEKGYTAWGQQSGAVARHSDRRILPRYPVAEAFADMGEFRTKAASRALPVEALQPWDPVSDSRQPVLHVTLAPGLDRLGQLACFVSRQGRVEVQWLEQGRRFSVKPGLPLSVGRSRVNCTVPGNDGRFYWFSHQWIIQN